MLPFLLREKELQLCVCVCVLKRLYMYVWRGYARALVHRRKWCMSSNNEMKMQVLEQVSHNRYVGFLQPRWFDQIALIGSGNDK